MVFRSHRINVIAILLAVDFIKNCGNFMLYLTIKTFDFLVKRETITLLTYYLFHIFTPQTYI